jgi:hypothetical protein
LFWAFTTIISLLKQNIQEIQPVSKSTANEKLHMIGIVQNHGHFMIMTLILK